MKNEFTSNKRKRVDLQEDKINKENIYKNSHKIFDIIKEKKDIKIIINPHKNILTIRRNNKLVKNKKEVIFKIVKVDKERITKPSINNNIHANDYNVIESDNKTNIDTNIIMNEYNIPNHHSAGIKNHLEISTNIISININPENAQHVCSICIDSVHFNDRHYLRCGHLYHNSCIEIWLRGSNQCPNCKQNITQGRLMRFINMNLSDSIDSSDTEYEEEILFDNSYMPSFHDRFSLSEVRSDESFGLDTCLCFVVLYSFFCIALKLVSIFNVA